MHNAISLHNTLKRNIRTLRDNLVHCIKYKHENYNENKNHESNIVWPLIPFFYWFQSIIFGTILLLQNTGVYWIYYAYRQLWKMIQDNFKTTVTCIITKMRRIAIERNKCSMYKWEKKIIVFFFFWNAILERYLPRWIFVINVLTAMTFWLSASSTKVM